MDVACSIMMQYAEAASRTGMYEGIQLTACWFSELHQRQHAQVDKFVHGGSHVRACMPCGVGLIMSMLVAPWIAGVHPTQDHRENTAYPQYL